MIMLLLQSKQLQIVLSIMLNVLTPPWKDVALTTVFWLTPLLDVVKSI